MKKISVCLILVLFATFTLPADDQSDVILQAQTDARVDGKNYHPFWWTLGGILLSSAGFVGGVFFDVEWPVLVIADISIAAGLPLLGYFTGQARVPAARIATIQDGYDDADLLSLYQTEYTKTLTNIQRRKRGNNALIGFGVSVGIMGLVLLEVLIAN